jgi:hypothetical protein
MSPRRLRVPSPQDRPLGRLRSRSPQSHQWNRELLEPGQTHAQGYNGSPKAHFPLFLKETEFRFNFGTPRPSNAGPNSRPCQPHLGQPLPHLLVHRNNRSTLASDPDQFPTHARRSAYDDREASVLAPMPSKALPICESLQIIQKRLRTTTFGLQIFLDSIF